MTEYQQQSVGQEEEEQEEEGHCKESYMLSLEVLHVAVVSPDSVRRELVSGVVWVTLEHLCDTESCCDGLEYLGVGQDEESGQYGDVAGAKDSHGCGGVVTGQYDCRDKTPDVEREGQLEPRLVVGVHARIEASLQSPVQVRKTRSIGQREQLWRVVNPLMETTLA